MGLRPHTGSGDERMASSRSLGGDSGSFSGQQPAVGLGESRAVVKSQGSWPRVVVVLCCASRAALRRASHSNPCPPLCRSSPSPNTPLSFAPPRLCPAACPHLDSYRRNGFNNTPLLPPSPSPALNTYNYRYEYDHDGGSQHPNTPNSPNVLMRTRSRHVLAARTLASLARHQPSTNPLPVHNRLAAHLPDILPHHTTAHAQLPCKMEPTQRITTQWAAPTRHRPSHTRRTRRRRLLLGVRPTCFRAWPPTPTATI